jgi:ribonuclease HI
MPFQEMWNGLASPGGLGCLYISGLSSNVDTPGPSGCGFHINANTRQGVLVQGYFYFAYSQTDHEMLYWGLMEGLEWACRLRLSQLCICGDSQVFLQQIAAAGECYAPDDNQEPRLRQLLDLVHISMVLTDGMNFTFRPIPREENGLAQGLASTAINSRENATVCNWSNIDTLSCD